MEEFWDQQKSYNSTGHGCSLRSERRGLHQRVVSFSFWGDLHTAYWTGVVENLRLMELHYPGWVLRLYVSEDLVSGDTPSKLCKLHNTYSR